MVNLYIDMDGCLAEFIVLDEKQQYRLYERGYFQNLKPQKGVIEGMRLFMRKHPEINFFILSAYLTDSKWALSEKKEWLETNFPDVKKENWIFVRCGQDKGDVVKKEGINILLDDHSPNLQHWVRKPQNKGVKLVNMINGKGQNWKGYRLRYDMMPETFSDELYSIINKEKKECEQE